MEKETVTNESSIIRGFSGPVGRRKFFFYGATALTTAAILASCKKDEPAPAPTPTPTADSADLGSGDAGILNYAYALEQLEAAFYLYVAAHPYSGISAAETAILNDIRDHEVVHRDFFKTAIGAAGAPVIKDLNVDFSSIDFSSRASVLGTAKAFEDLGVSAYNGAGKLLKSADYLLLAGKIVSVEARHASTIRDLLNPNSMDFAGNDVVTVDNGLDMARTPTEVLTIASKYVKTQINFSNLPK
jgi:hypothetical protein